HGCSSWRSDQGRDRGRLRDLDRVGEAVVPPGRHRRRHPRRPDHLGAVRAGPVAPGQASPGDGERDPAPGRGVLRQGRAPKMTYPLVQELAAEGFPVRLTCGVLGFSPQAFYKWRARPCSRRDHDDAYVTNALVDLHAEDPAFGYRFLADELAAAGHRAGERRVWRLCSQQRLWSTTTKKG